MSLNDRVHGLTTIVEASAQNKNSQGGTGFFYAQFNPPWSESSDPQWRAMEKLWVVTNQHVLLPKISDQETAPSEVIFNHRMIGTSGNLQWLPISFTTPQLESVAKFHIHKEVDVVVIEVTESVNEAASQSNLAQMLSPLHEGLFAGKNNIEVEASSDVLVVGYPQGFYDDVNLFPIVKQGIVSSRWDIGFKGEPYFLIDAKLLPGSSGSAVISKPLDLVVKDGKMLVAPEKQFAFLGVYSAEYVGYDLGVVWHAELIEEIINNGVSMSQALC